jgi:hypothetical protein
LTDKKTATKKIIFTLIPFLLAILIMLPRLSSAQFGFFDDARMLQQSKAFLNGDFSMSHDLQAGRFRPVYWLYYTLIYALVGYHPFSFFIGNLFIFLLLLYQIKVICQQMGFMDWQTLITSLLFVLSMPIIENFYTLSKGEPLQLVFLLLSVILLGKLKAAKLKTNIILIFIASTITILFAIMVKETAIIMLPIAAIWTLYPYFTKDETLRKERSTYLVYSGSIALGILLYLSIRTSINAPSLVGGTYTNRYLSTISSYFEKILRWMTQLAFYFHYLIPLVLIFFLLLLLKKSFRKKEGVDLFRWAIWSLMWFAVLIPWEYAELYYLLPFAMGTAILIGLLSPKIIRKINKGNRFQTFSLVSLYSVTGLLFLLTIPNYFTDVRTQLTFDRMNNQMLAFIVKTTPTDGTVLINLEINKEYSERLELSLKVHHGLPEIEYGNIDYQRMDHVNKETGAIILMPLIENQPRLSVRVGVKETFQTPWNNILLSQISGNKKLLLSINENFYLSNVNLPILICPILGEKGFCEDPDPLFDTRLFRYGWEVYEIQ